MFSNFPHLRLPETITKLCCLPLDNGRRTYTEIYDLLEEDRFMFTFVKTIFEDDLDKGGILGLLTSMGWKGFRDRLTEAYLYYARFGRYPHFIELDEVYDVLDFENRFNFLLTENNSRVFLLGFYLKLGQIELEKASSEMNDILSIPVEVDEILIEGKSHLPKPDWLILLIWGLFESLGKNAVVEHLKKDDIAITNILSQEHYKSLTESFLTYGHAINDDELFVMKKV